MKKLNLNQRKLNKQEVEFLLWFLAISNDNPIQHPPEDTVFSYDDSPHSAVEFRNVHTKLKAIYKSYIS